MKSRMNDTLKDDLDARLGALGIWLMIMGWKPIETSKQGSFQIIDVVDAMWPITKVL